MDQTLTKGITEWLDRGGYPLELYVVKILKELGFFCSKSLLFSDEESQKAREIDVVAEKYTRSSDLTETLLLKLVIECKKSSNAFVVLCDSSEEETILNSVFLGNLIVGSEDDKFVFMSLYTDSVKPQGQQLFSAPTLNIPSRRGYTLLQAHQQSDSHIYSEIYKLAKAYYFEIQKEDNFRNRVLAGSDTLTRAEMVDTFHFHLPVLVVDAPLVEVYLDESGNTQIEVKQISSIKIRLPWKASDKDYNPDEGLSIVIVTKEKVSDFAKDAIAFAKEVVDRRNEE